MIGWMIERQVARQMHEGWMIERKAERRMDGWIIERQTEGRMDGWIAFVQGSAYGYCTDTAGAFQCFVSCSHMDVSSDAPVLPLKSLHSFLKTIF